MKLVTAILVVALGGTAVHAQCLSDPDRGVISNSAKCQVDRLIQGSQIATTGSQARRQQTKPVGSTSSNQGSIIPLVVIVGTLGFLGWLTVVLRN